MSTQLLHHSWIAVSFENQGITLIHLEDKDGALKLEADQKIYFQNKSINGFFEDKDNNLFLIDRNNGLLKIVSKKQQFNKLIISLQQRS